MTLDPTIKDKGGKIPHELVSGLKNPQLHSDLLAAYKAEIAVNTMFNCRSYAASDIPSSKLFSILK